MKFIRKVEDIQYEYENVLIVHDPQLLCHISGKQMVQGKVLMVSTEYAKGLSCDQLVVSRETYTKLLQLYLTYEFSDKFRIISMDGNYGTLWNYVKTGILTHEEAVEALLKRGGEKNITEQGD